MLYNIRNKKPQKPSIEERQKRLEDIKKEINHNLGSIDHVIKSPSLKGKMITKKIVSKEDLPPNDFSVYVYNMPAGLFGQKVNIYEDLGFLHYIVKTNNGEFFLDAHILSSVLDRVIPNIKNEIRFLRDFHLKASPLFRENMSIAIEYSYGRLSFGMNIDKTISREQFLTKIEEAIYRYIVYCLSVTAERRSMGIREPIKTSSGKYEYKNVYYEMLTRGIRNDKTKYMIIEEIEKCSKGIHNDFGLFGLIYYMNPKTPPREIIENENLKLKYRECFSDYCKVFDRLRKEYIPYSYYEPIFRYADIGVPERVPKPLGINREREKAIRKMLHTNSDEVLETQKTTSLEGLFEQARQKFPGFLTNTPDYLFQRYYNAYGTIPLEVDTLVLFIKWCEQSGRTRSGRRIES